MEARSYQMSPSASFQLTELDPDTASVRSDSHSHPNKTVVSIVIDDNDLNDTEKEQKQQHDRDKTYSRSILLSTVYGVILILFGLVFPVTEALKRQINLTNHYVAAFSGFQYGVSVAFLLYLQLFLMTDGKKTSRPAEDATATEAKAAARPGEVVVLRRCVSASNIVDDASRTDDDHRSHRSARTGILKDTDDGSSVKSLSFASPPSTEVGPRQKRCVDDYLPNSRVEKLRTNKSSSNSKADFGDMTGSVDSGIFASRMDQLRRRVRHISEPSITEENDGRVRTSRAEVTSTALSSVGGDDGIGDCTSLFTLDDEVSDEVVEYINLRHQTASLSHDGTSFYLRLGSLAFGVGNLIFVGLQIRHYSKRNCDRILYPVYLHLIFVLVQTFFLFKNSQWTIKKHKAFVRFGLMHVLATNLSVWLRVLVVEVVESIVHSEHTGTHGDRPPGMVVILPIGKNSSELGCHSEGSLFQFIAPYLFPFILEYSLIAVATMLGLFNSLSIHVTRDIVQSVKKLLQSRRRAEAKARLPHAESHEGHDMDKAHRGIFLGMLVLAGTIISIIVFFFSLRGDTERGRNNAALIYHTSDLMLHALLLGSVLAAIVKLSTLKYSFARNNSIDHMLMIFSMSGLIMFEMFVCLSSILQYMHRSERESLADGVSARYVFLLSGLVSISGALQGILQTIFIIDGMQRCAATEKERREKPGRAIVTFLLIVNLALWILRTFQVKTIALEDHLEFYGVPAWPIILNINLPLMLFFRFHSSVCLADIWMAAYIADEKSIRPVGL